MANTNFDACLAFVLRYEGGYVDHPRDPGGATNKGITIGTLKAWRKQPVTKADVRNIGMEEVRSIYRVNYWNAAGCNALAPGVDLAVFDPAVNSGVGRARQWYANARSKHVESKSLVRAICATRMAFVRSLKTWSTFGKGWAARLAAVEACALAMIAKAAGKSVEKEMKAEAKDAQMKRDATGTGAATTTTGAGTAGGTAATSPDPWTATEIVLVSGVIVGAVCLAGWLAYRCYVNHQRKRAFDREANLASGI